MTPCAADADTATAQNWVSLFPALSQLEAETVKHLARTSQIVDLPAGQQVFHTGDACQNFLLVLNGVVRVQMTSETGREIVLYRVDAGETCVLTTACLLGHDPYSAEGITETPVRAVAVPARVFQDLMGRSTALRDFVFQSYGTRLANLMVLVEEVAFGRLDIRLAKFLCENSDAHNHLTLTHQKLAVELGSAREVISRQLKEFERRGLLSLSRGQITILQPGQLRTIAGT